jgi:phenylpyruvate tautomerase PptA (4-oxalocrotonate tautomerase family)
MFALRHSRIAGKSLTKRSQSAEIAAKVTEVLADLILMAPRDEQPMLNG